MIRPATPSDVDDICALWNDVITSTTITFTTQNKTPQDVLQTLDGPWPTLIATRNGAFSGFASLSPFRAGPGYRHVAEHTVYLRDDAQGAGQGKALMMAVQKSAKGIGLRALIGAVSGSNLAAVAFHEKLGFSKVGVLPEIGEKWGTRLDLILMQKNL
ncbi:N-acetyltransferase family protein [Ascidiaceihabitans sp.]|uniref:GNAT family N-acetyltransferase n=1 Tax=Ascidiaceihabitans sp. TaxID=1872644 RepID=UPI0032988203